MATSRALNFDRRLFLLGASALALTSCGWPLSSDSSSSAAAVDYNALVIPPLLTGTTFDLSLAASEKQFVTGAKTPTYGYNGADFWGPTLLWKKGDTITLNVTNNLDEETSAHWHGVHLPAKADGGPLQPIAPGETWSPSFEVMNDAATYWYHPHMHQMTQSQLTKGAGGFIIVQDDTESALALPRTYGVDDIPLVLTSRRFSTTNEFEVTDTAYGDYLLANGVMNAEAELPAQQVRFRILNAETERYYNLGFENDRKFQVIGTDGGLLNAPVEVTRIRMAPGERYEIVIDLSGEAVGSGFDMQAFNEGMTFGAGGSETAQSGAFGSLLNNTTFTLLHLSVVAATSDGVTAVPAALATNRMWTAADVTKKRTIAITDNGPGTPFTFDGNSYSMDTINQTVALDAIEAWTISNDFVFGHSFHIHDVQFSIISRSSGDVAEYEKG